MSHNPQKLEHTIQREITAFLIDRQARALSETTILYYQSNLLAFQDYLKSIGVTTIEALTPTHIRTYFIHLSATCNPGGIHAHYRAIKAFLNWWSEEYEDPNWRNPIKKIKPPKVSNEPLPGISLNHIQKLLVTCDKSFIGQRDRTIILFLLDTGLRRAEFCKLDYCDIELKSGAVQIRSGKGNKDRTVYTGARARRELMRYLRHRPALDDHDPLWVTRTQTRLTHSGLRQILRRRSERCGIPEPQIHDFRRTFAIQSLRNGIDIITLMRLMGHSSTTVLQRYLRLVQSDLQEAHQRTSPADNLK